MILEAVAIPIMIVNIILMRMPNTDFGMNTGLLMFSTFMFVAGALLSHLSEETKNKEEKEK